MNIPKLDIGGLLAEIPIIQGAMGIGVSGPELAAAVANEGGVGVIAGVNIGYNEPDFKTNTLAANLRALKKQIKQARQLAPKGIIGINLMVAMNHYIEIAHAAVHEGIDLIISGAGLPTNLPETVQGFKTRIAPIVSSGKASKIILQYWDKHYGRIADMVIVEGPEAGGHLGFSQEILNAQNKPSVIDIVKEVIAAVKPFEEKYKKNIPVIAAGGIYTGSDIADCLNAGASGVQMATRFVATDECDADIRFKEKYIAAKNDDVVIIKSPVGLPGRALNNKFIQELDEYREKIAGCVQCLKGCNPKVAPYCISTALINAVRGNIDDGLVFVGSNVYKIDKIVSVKSLIEELLNEMALAPNQ
ncbi:Dihydroorotate dehydrogenase [bioreactor metagenome]|uniref:Dihydroorotate dehydrogenase n=1 Tax=bioreactor metagenome TaxID=1076179 RepID=A0A644WMI1_9ZZZZ